MIGMTPDWLTFSGMYVFWPPIMRRPTTRLANCTGIRRWPSSTNTTAMMIRIVSTIIATNQNTLSSWRIA